MHSKKGPKALAPPVEVAPVQLWASPANHGRRLGVSAPCVPISVCRATPRTASRTGRRRTSTSARSLSCAETPPVHRRPCGRGEACVRPRCDRALAASGSVRTRQAKGERGVRRPTRSLSPASEERSIAMSAATDSTGVRTARGNIVARPKSTDYSVAASSGDRSAVHLPPRQDGPALGRVLAGHPQPTPIWAAASVLEMSAIYRG